MAKIEPGVYEPRADDIRVFDGAEDDVDEEGSRLPLLIVIALLVLAAFGGVVYLAYTEGVQKGRADAPRIITAQPGPAKVAPTDAGGTETPYKGLKIYEQPAPTDEDVEDSAPPPPTAVSPSTTVTPTTTATPAPAAAKPTRTAAATAPAATKPAPAASTPAAPQPKPATTLAVAKPPITTAPAATTTATAAPRTLTPAATKPAETKPAPIETKPAPASATTAAVPAAATGSFLVQVASFPSEADANAAFATLKRKNGALLSGMSSNIKRVDLGAKGVWYRLRVGPFADKDAASGVAERLGGGAFATKP